MLTCILASLITHYFFLAKIYYSLPHPTPYEICVVNPSEVINEVLIFVCSFFFCLCCASHILDISYCFGRLM